MKCRQRKIGIAQPAIAVVPVASSAQLLRKARREGCQYGAGVLIAVELQGQSRADNFLLMQQRDRAVFDPDAPVAYRLFEKVVRDLHQIVFNTESPRESEIEFLRQRDGSFLAEVG